MMSKAVLIPVDLAQTGNISATLNIAKTLAAASGARMFLLNVVEEIPPYAAVHIPSGLQETAVSDSTSALERVKSEYGLPENTAILVRAGHASRTILNVAEEIDSDVIVMASHDPGIADYFLGSVAAHVVRHAHCSVHVVRKVNQ